MCTDIIVALILQWMVLSPGSRPMRDPEYRSEVAAAICAEAEEHDISAELLASMAFHESSFSTEAIGTRGEVGLMQVHGAAAAGCELESVRGQVACGAAWLARWRDLCPKGRGWYGPLVGYASGACSTDSERLRGRIMLRLRKAGVK